MIATLRTHLWKEWREQRAALLQLSLVIAVGFSLAAFLLPAALLGDPILRQVAALIPFVVICGTVVPDLLSRERKNGGIVFLARTPGGLRSAWIAKFIIAFVLVGVALMAGEFAAQWISAPLASSQQPVWTPTSDATGALILVVLVAWTFAVSAWLSNGLLALPCAVILTAATIAPALWMSASIDRSRVETIFFVLVPLGASIGLCGSWLAFVSGPRRGRSQRWITAVGVSACVSGLIPSAAPAAIRAGFPPRQFSVEPVALTDDDVFLFHHVIRSASSTTDDEVALVRIDLRTREVRVDDATLAVNRVIEVRHMSPWSYRGLEPVIGETDDPDTLTAAVGTVPVPAGHPIPADFGRADVTNRFSVDCIGAGHRLNVYRANSKQRYFRDRAGAHCFALEELDALASDVAIEDAVVTTTDTWLVRDDRRAWWWLDVRTGEHEPCDALARDSVTGWSFGPSTVDGKLLVADEDGLQVLDANTHERRLVEGGERVHGMCRVLDDQACSLPANDAAVWLNVYVGDTVDDRKQAAFLIDIANARIVDRVIFEDPYARLLAANDDGVLYQSARSGDVKWFDCATRESRTLIVAVP